MESTGFKPARRLSARRAFLLAALLLALCAFAVFAIRFSGAGGKTPSTSADSQALSGSAQDEDSSNGADVSGEGASGKETDADAERQNADADAQGASGQGSEGGQGDALPSDDAAGASECPVSISGMELVESRSNALGRAWDFEGEIEIEGLVEETLQYLQDSAYSLRHSDALDLFGKAWGCLAMRDGEVLMIVAREIEAEETDMTGQGQGEEGVDEKAVAACSLVVCELEVPDAQ